MKITQLLLSVSILFVLTSCLKNPNDLTLINSESFHPSQVEVHFEPLQPAVADTLKNAAQDQDHIIKEINNMQSLNEQIRQMPSDTLWHQLTRKWNEFNHSYFGQSAYPESQVSKETLSPEATRRWAQLNADLVRLSEEVRFGDALEVLLYNTKGADFPETLLKSVIFTHVYDQIYVNVIGASFLEYQHTTGGTVKIIQQTTYPKSNEMILVCECNDLRYMDIFIRIPSWAVNPSVTHGNVKYVANPGEYCQVSKKWKTGDELRIVLRQ